MEWRRFVTYLWNDPRKNNNNDDIYSAVIVAEPLREFTWFTR